MVDNARGPETIIGGFRAGPLSKVFFGVNRIEQSVGREAKAMAALICINIVFIVDIVVISTGKWKYAFHHH